MLTIDVPWDDAIVLADAANLRLLSGEELFSLAVALDRSGKTEIASDVQRGRAWPQAWKEETEPILARARSHVVGLDFVPPGGFILALSNAASKEESPAYESALMYIDVASGELSLFLASDLFVGGERFGLRQNFSPRWSATVANGVVPVAIRHLQPPANVTPVRGVYWTTEHASISISVSAPDGGSSVAPTGNVLFFQPPEGLAVTDHPETCLATVKRVDDGHLLLDLWRTETAWLGYGICEAPQAPVARGQKGMVRIVRREEGRYRVEWLAAVEESTGAPEQPQPPASFVRKLFGWAKK
jgi:hypothetical protein